MRYACRTSYHERCPGRWCTCSCHQAEEESFRSRFTDTEWALYSAGKCCWQTAYGMPWMEWCGQPSMPGQQFGYCPEHDRELRDQEEVMPSTRP